MNQPAEPSPNDRPDTDTAGRIVAHRGARRVAPENTLAAFRIAAGQGASWIEFDASLLGDGTAVLHHDGTLDRCTDASGPLAGLSAADLGRIDAGSWFGPGFAGEPLATLEQALELIGALALSANLEMKPHDAPPDAMARAVAAALGRRPWTRRRILVSSFDHASLRALRRLMPEQPLAMLYEDPPADWPAVLAALNACSLHVRHDRLDDDILARAAAEQVHVRVYTINKPARVARFRNSGLTGVITDHPPLFLQDPDWAAWAADQAV
jgi:glycerophosphoryl diester phosphodiesterase